MAPLTGPGPPGVGPERLARRRPLSSGVPWRRNTGVGDTLLDMYWQPGRRWPWWVVEAAVAGVAFMVAYWPLQNRPEGLSLALTAMGTVAYAALTVEIALLNRRQVHTLGEQLSIQREDLEQQRAALASQREEAERQARYAENMMAVQREEAERQARHADEAREVARRTFLESVYARYDASAPQMSVSLWDRVMITTLVVGPSGQRVEAWPSFLEGDQLDEYHMTMMAAVNCRNFGPTGIIVTNLSLTSGQMVDEKESPWPTKWVMEPSSPDSAVGTMLFWRYSGSASHCLAVLGQGSAFGVKFILEASDLVRNVTDTHTLEFAFTLIQRDGSRARLHPPPIPIINKDPDGDDTGGVARVERKYRNPLGE